MILCHNNLTNQGEVHDVIVHELEHGADDCKNLNWGDCVARACSELKSYLKADWCNVPGKKKAGESYNDCTRRWAYLSVRGKTNCTPNAVGWAAVLTAWANPRCRPGVTNP